jgi:hypothetical protein
MARTIGHHRTSTPDAPSVRRRTREDGVALLELSICVGLLAVLLFGIITFGVTMSFRQTLDQAANEGARAAAVAPASPATLAGDRARTVVNRVLAADDVACDDGSGLTCSFIVAPCDGDAGRRCMTIELSYDLRNNPRVSTVAGVDRALPSNLVSRVVVEVGA